MFTFIQLHMLFFLLYRLVHSGLTKDSCEIISAALQSEGTQLTEVDLSFNAVGDSGVKVLVNGLTDRNSRLDTLRLVLAHTVRSLQDSRSFIVKLP